MGPKATRTRMVDVARAAGVSRSTVSFVLNQTAGQTIPMETQDRVRAAASELGYVPSRLALALRSGSSQTVVLATGGLLTGHSLETFIAGMDEELRALGFALLVLHSHGPNAVSQEVLDIVSPRAVLDMGQSYRGSVEPAWEGGWTHGMASHGLVQLTYLVEQGHRHIALAAPAGGRTRVTRRRVTLLREAAVRLGIPVPPVLRVGTDSGPDMFESLRAEHPEVTAVAAFSDDEAILVLAAMSDAGLRAPDDYAVMGFGDSRYGEIWRPALTTVRIDAAAFGRRTARLMLNLDLADFLTPPSTVIVRASA